MIERIELKPGYSISRIIKGGWHLAGGHGYIEEDAAIDDMLQFVKSGITTFDCADIYTGVEELIGKFLRKHHDAFANGSLAPVQIHTKYVPDYNALSSINRKNTTEIIDRSLVRLGVERLDLVQFAWWDYTIPGYIEAALYLKELQQAGKIRFIGATNFDKDHLKEMTDAGVEFLAHQVQYSVLDNRVEKDLIPFQQDHNISTLCYGVIAGGFLSNRYLGVLDPTHPLENRSLTKYRLIIQEYGGWDQFQDTLKVLNDIASRHNAGIAEIASRYILDRNCVGAIIIGARNTDHLDKIRSISQINLDDHDMESIQQAISQSRGPLGPFYGLERIKDGPHGSIMKYNLNIQE